MTNAELREFCTQMIGKFKLLSDIQKEMQYETIDAKFTEWELKKLIFALNVLREEVRKYVDTADTPQTERIKTPDYCDICNHKGCDNCIANSLDDYCVPSGYEPITQTETQNSNLTFDTPQTESTGSPIGDYRDGVGAWQTERMTEEEIDTMLAKALVGQTDCGWGEPK